MADVKWIKLSTDIFDYDRIKSVEEIENGDAILCMWFRLLVGAKLKNRYGILEYKIGNIELTDEVLKTVFRYKYDIHNALVVLEENGFIIRNKKNILVLPFWQDRHDRNSTRYRDWRCAVFERDGYTCQGCGTKKNLQAHHIITWEQTKDNTELRYSIDNGITLCRACHLEAHGGGWR